jgi:hypothetical protein
MSHKTSAFCSLCFQFHFEGNSAIFLVNGRDTANALRAASGKFRAPNGFKVGMSLFFSFIVLNCALLVC